MNEQQQLNNIINQNMGFSNMNTPEQQTQFEENPILEMSLGDILQLASMSLSQLQAQQAQQAQQQRYGR